MLGRKPTFTRTLFPRSCLRWLVYLGSFYSHSASAREPSPWSHCYRNERLTHWSVRPQTQALSSRLWPKVSPSFLFFLPQPLTHSEAGSNGLTWEVLSSIRFPWVTGESWVDCILSASLDTTDVSKGPSKTLLGSKDVVLQVVVFYCVPWTRSRGIWPPSQVLLAQLFRRSRKWDVPWDAGLSVPCAHCTQVTGSWCHFLVFIIFQTIEPLGSIQSMLGCLDLESTWFPLRKSAPHLSWSHEHSARLSSSWCRNAFKTRTVTFISWILPLKYPIQGF